MIAFPPMLAEERVSTVSISLDLHRGRKTWRPDMGFLSKDDMLDTARKVVRSCSYSIICDMEEGYGSALQIQRHNQRNLSP